jgi:organic radical activating enzyme
MKDSLPSPYFCIAPWTHTYISPQSERRICCASREQATWTKQYIDSDAAVQSGTYIPITLEQHWNGEHMKSVRKRIIQGDRIPECEVCHSQQLNLHTYRNYFTKTLFPDKIQQALESTDDDGYTTMQPVSFDYRIYNLCNFKCRMCGEQLSSSWETEKRLMNTWRADVDQWMIPVNKKVVEEFQKSVVEQELWDAVKEDRIEEIYWVGGEPLMYQIHWDIMKYLVDNDQAHKVTVRYNTNLSLIERNGTKLYDLLPHFKNVNMCCSQDATGKIAEFVRTGLKYDRWLDYFKQGIFLNSQFGSDAMVIDVTVTLPGLLDMKNLMNLAVELGVKSYVKITFDFDSGVLMSPMSLPRKILDPILMDLIDYEKSLESDLTKVYRETFENMLSRPTFEEKYPDQYIEGARRGKARLQSIAEFRKDGYNGHALTIEEILAANDSVLSWWNSI